ncbi:death on curing protein, Doc toxin [Vibrio cholerae]|nr:death on curing protein, Doc toxin [Vibrio cholerae]
MELCKELKKLLVYKALNKRLKMDCQRVAFPVPLSRGGYGCCD